MAASQLTSLRDAITALRGADQRAIQSLESLYQRERTNPLRTHSPLTFPLQPVITVFDSIDASLGTTGNQITQMLRERLEQLERELPAVEAAKRAFDEAFDNQKAGLDPEQRIVLETHRQVAEETAPCRV